MHAVGGLPARKRTGRPHTKNGCRTCKNRHKRCGEETPECLRCLRAGYECVYESKEDKAKNKNIVWTEVIVPGKDAKKATSLDGPRRRSSGETTLSQTPRTTAFETDSEYGYFLLVQNRTKGYSSGKVDDILWGKIALQACYQEGFAKHALLALAAAEKALATRVWSPTSDISEWGQSHTDFALKHYAKALRLLVEDNRMKNRIDDEYVLRNTVLSSILVATLETYLGNCNFGTMLSIVAKGLRLVLAFFERRMGRKILLSEIEQTAVLDADFIATLNYGHTFIVLSSKSITSLYKDKVPKRQDSSGVTHKLKEMTDEKVVLRIGSTFVQKNYITATILNAPLAARRDIPPPISQSLLGAWNALQDLSAPSQIVFKTAAYRLEEAHRKESIALAPDADVSRFPGIGGRRTPTRQQSQRQIEGAIDEHTQRIANWEKIYMPQLEYCIQDQYHDVQFQDATILAIKYLGIRLASIPVEFQNEICDYVHRIVTLAKPIILTSTDQTVPVVFLSSLNIGNELQVAVSKCKDPELRKEVLELMYKHPKGNGLWDMTMLAKHAEWGIQMEADFAAGKPLSPEAHVIMEYVSESEALRKLSASGPSSWVNGFNTKSALTPFRRSVGWQIPD